MASLDDPQDNGIELYAGSPVDETSCVFARLRPL